MAYPQEKADRALQVVIVYKLIKGIAALVLAVVLAAANAFGIAGWIQDTANDVATNLTQQWSIELAETIFRAATPKHLYIAAGALVAEGILTTVEGWGLHRRQRWAAWLVVIASGSLLPFEIVGVVRHISPFRVGVLAVNLVIVLFLGRRLAREHAAHVEQQQFLARRKAAEAEAEAAAKAAEQAEKEAANEAEVGAKRPEL